MIRRQRERSRPGSPEELELKIYKTYRAALRSVSRNRSRRAKAPARRRRARQMTMARHNVDYATLVRIVAEQDVVHGVTHEHPAPYLLALKLHAVAAEHAADPRPCTTCGGDVLVRVRAHRPHGCSWAGEYFLGCFHCYLRSALPILRVSHDETDRDVRADGSL